MKKLEDVKQNARISFILLAQLANPETLIVEINNHPASLLELFVYFNFSNNKFHDTMTDMLYCGLIGYVSTVNANLVILNPDYVDCKWTATMKFMKDTIFNQHNMDKINTRNPTLRKKNNTNSLKIVNARIKKIIKEM